MQTRSQTGNTPDTPTRYEEEVWTPGSNNSAETAGSPIDSVDFGFDPGNRGMGLQARGVGRLPTIGDIQEDTKLGVGDALEEEYDSDVEESDDDEESDDEEEESDDEEEESDAEESDAEESDAEESDAEESDAEESDMMFNHMMAKLVAFKATGQFGEEFDSNQFPIFDSSPPDGHPYPAAFCTHSESEESGDNLDSGKGEGKGKRVSFEDEDEVHTVPNQQQEDRYGTWMADGIRESRQNTSRPARKLATPKAEHQPPSALPTHAACDDETIVLLDRDGVLTV